jgi:hypothetical protein
MTRPYDQTPPAPSPPERRWQFSLRTMFISITAISVVLTLIAHRPLVVLFIFCWVAPPVALEVTIRLMAKARFRNFPVLIAVWFSIGIGFLGLTIAGSAATIALMSPAVVHPLVSIGLMPMPTACSLYCAFAAWRSLLRYIYDTADGQ